MPRLSDLPAAAFRTAWLPLLLLAACLPEGGHAGQGKACPGPGPEASAPGLGFRAEAIQGVQALAPFFRDLDALALGRDRVVRILQFGDSHTAEGSWTDRMRSHFQARFGDAGPGLVLPARPWRGFGHEGLTLSEGWDWPSLTLKTPREGLPVGLTGAALTLPPRAVFRVRGAFGRFEVQSLGPSRARASVTLAGSQAGEAGSAPSQPLRLARTLTPLAHGQALARVRGESRGRKGPLELAVALPPPATLLGVDLLSGRPGVVYDELGIWGAWLLELKHGAPGLRRALLRSTKASLMILAYGTNEMGWEAYDLGSYEAEATALLRALRKEAAGAAFLVVGPMDRGGTTDQARTALAARADRIIEGLRRSAAATGCAFWDARAALGGKGADGPLCARGLAAGDGIHLTPAGYRLLGDLLFEALWSAYGDRRGLRRLTALDFYQY